jgi:hypothetical protein
VKHGRSPPTHLDNEHSFFRVLGINLADAAGEHDRLEPGPALAALHAQVKGTGEALNQRLAELVAVVGRAIAGLNLNGQGRGETTLCLLPAATLL